MDSYRDLLREKEAQNWVKAAVALKITKEGLQGFVDDVLTCVHQDIYSTVRTSKGLSAGATCAQCFTENVLTCPTRGICTSIRNCKFHNAPQKLYAQCPNGICEGVRDEIVQYHMFSGPSWKNTNADKWSTVPWEIGKCFLPPDGYKTVSAIKDSDFNGVISVMMNCKEFLNRMANQTNLLEEVRDIGRLVRHSNDQKVKDVELVDFLFKLRTLLEDKTELANRLEAQHAVEQLKKLQTDEFKLSAGNELEILMEGLRLRLANHYQTTLADMPVSPILVEKNTKLSRFYVVPKITEKDHRKIGRIDKEEREVSRYSDIFCNAAHEFVRNIFLVGEPGKGKSTFAVMCVLEWTQQYLPVEGFEESKTSNADSEFIQEFAFLFHVTLRDSCNSCELTEMIKDQIISKIYHKKDADDGFRLLQNVLESEKCLIIADGLDEWNHPENVSCTCKTDEKVIPFRNSANKATLLTTTRPWRLSQLRVQDSKIDKYLEIEGAENPLQLVENILSVLNEDTEDKRTPEAFMKMVSAKGLIDLLSAPISITQLVCMWFEGISLTNSKCDVYAGVINMLSHRKSCMLRQHKIPKIELPSVFKKHECFMQNPMDYLKLAKLAYITLFSEFRKSSVVFSDNIVYAVLDKELVEFALKSGLLTEKKSNSLIKRTSHFSFFHKTVQEFLAALHLCLNGNDFDQLLKKYATDNEQNIFGDVSQVFIFICGMKPELGVQMSSWINSSIQQLSVHFVFPLDGFKYEVAKPTDVKILQNLIVSGYCEAKANNHGVIPLSLKHFEITGYNQDVISLKELMRINRCFIQSMSIRTCTDGVSKDELQEVFNSSSGSLKAVDLLFCDGQYDLSQCNRLEYLGISDKRTSRVQVDATNITSCQLIGVCLDVESHILRSFKNDGKSIKVQHASFNFVNNIQLLCDTLSSLSQLQYLRIGNTDLGKLHLLPPASINHIDLLSVEITADAMRSLVEEMKNIPHIVKCAMINCKVEPVSELGQIKNFLESSEAFNLDRFDELNIMFTKT